ncbi:MAG: OmpA family protein [Alcaligenaceae bacterium]|nr:OmpA family protein [Alcaligenaceae bacterium]
MSIFKSIRAVFLVAIVCLLSACASISPNNNMSALEITQDTRGVAIASRDSDLFLPGSGALSPNAPPFLDRVAALLKDRPQRKVLIDSITENAGSLELNHELQEVRSLKIMKALTDRGIDKNRLAYTQASSSQNGSGSNYDSRHKTKIIILGETTSDMNVSAIERFFDGIFQLGNNIFN